MNNTPQQPPIEKIAAEALNEQGYLFQHKLVNNLLADQSRKGSSDWQVEATELPVALPTGEETRIDIVLRLGIENSAPVRAVIECKRSARDYKRWIFFSQNQIQQNPLSEFYYVERAQLKTGGWDHKKEPDICHRIDPKPASEKCPVFEYGVEAKVNRKDHEKRVSATDAIESAFQQVTLAQAGLGVQLRKSEILNFRILPVVVTTAEILSAHFDTAHVTLNRGEIEPEHIILKSRKWLGINFRIREAIAAATPMGLHNHISLASNLTLRQVRTVFIVEAERAYP